MSDYKTVEGFGGVKFVHEGGTATFDYLANKGTVEWIPVLFDNKAWNGTKIVKLKYWEAIIELQLSNLMPDDYLNFFKLIAIINGFYVTETPITVYPRYDALSVYTTGLECVFRDKIKFEDIRSFEAGQKLLLKFENKYPIYHLPAMINAYNPDYLLKEDGDALLLESGDKIIIDK